MYGLAECLDEDEWQCDPIASRHFKGATFTEFVTCKADQMLSLMGQTEFWYEREIIVRVGRAQHAEEEHEK